MPVGAGVFCQSHSNATSLVLADKNRTAIVIFNLSVGMHPQKFAHDDGLFRRERIEWEKVGHGFWNVEHTGVVNRSIPYDAHVTQIDRARGELTQSDFLDQAGSSKSPDDLCSGRACAQAES